VKGPAAGEVPGVEGTAAPGPSLGREGHPAVVAHRGASAREAENTLPAFEAAIRAGADAIEFDVRMTADGVAVVMHDPDVSRTTDGSGLVRDLRLADVKGLRIRLLDGGSSEVPTLEEALSCLSARVGADIEIKNVPGEPDFEPDREAAVEATLAALERIAFVGDVLISSFNPFAIARARELAPTTPTGLLTDRDVDARVALGFALEHGHAWILPHVARVLDAGEGFMEEAHAAGALVGTWLTDDASTAVSLMRAGVDAVATNDPAVIVAARDAAAGWPPVV
jgi:glycerophosphoryl diester phosphodiesterase